MRFPEVFSFIYALTVAHLAAGVPFPAEEDGRMSILPIPEPSPVAVPVGVRDNLPTTSDGKEKRDPDPLIIIRTSQTIYTTPSVWTEGATSRISWPRREARDVTSTQTTTGEEAGSTSGKTPGIWDESAATSTSSATSAPSPTSFVPAAVRAAAAVEGDSTSAMPGVWHEGQGATSYISWPPSPSPTGTSPDDTSSPARIEEVVNAATQVDAGSDDSSAGTPIGAILLYIGLAVVVLVIGWGVVWQCFLKPRRKRQEREKRSRERKRWGV